MRNDCLSYGNGQKTCNLFGKITVKRLAEKQYVVRLITNTTTGSTGRVKFENKKFSEKRSTKPYEKERNLQHRSDIKLPQKKPDLSGIVQGRFGGELSGFSK